MQHDVRVSDCSLQKPASESILGIDAKVRGETETLQRMDEVSTADLHLFLATHAKDTEACFKFMGAHSFVPLLLQTHLIRNS